MHWLDTAHALSEITRTTLSLFLSCLRLVSCVLVSGRSSSLGYLGELLLERA